MGKTTITVDQETLDRFKRLKRELEAEQPDTPGHNADSFMKCLMDTYDAVQDGHYGEPDDPLTLSEVDEIANELARQFDYAELSNQVAREITEELR